MKKLIIFFASIHGIKAAESKFDIYAQRAEVLYQQSSDRPRPFLKEKPLLSDQRIIEPVKSTEKPEVFKSRLIGGKPIFSAHIQFSDSWWKELLDKCDGAPGATDKSPLDGEALLKKNRQWLEVKKMGSSAKQIVMKRVLSELERDWYSDDLRPICRVMCALLVGADANARGEQSHTALHVAAMSRHYSLYRLLLEKGADPHELCRPAHPRDFTPGEWIGLYEKYANKSHAKHS